ncbi:MAG: DUF3325 domain-containing protein [Porticoccaceae bacterium]|nr:DUF3325 domain-containing protein [Porticoccaceae bacterium]
MSAGPLATLTQLMLALAGFACLALSMERHARQAGLRIKHQSRRSWLRMAGWSLLTITFMTATTNTGWGFGLVLVFGVLSVAALLVVGLLTYRPALLIATATGSGLAGAALLLVAI